MSIDRTGAVLGQVFFQRCFYLFFALLALAMAVFWLEPSPLGRVLLNALNLLLDVSAVAAVARTRWSFVIASLLAIPAMVYQLRAIVADDTEHLLGSWIFSAALY